MMNYIMEYRYVIVFAICFIIYCGFEWRATKDKIYITMLKAKQLAKEKVLSGGQKQEDWVVSVLIKILPKPVLLLLNEDMLRLIVRYLYRDAMDFLDDGKLNNSYSYS